MMRLGTVLFCTAVLTFSFATATPSVGVEPAKPDVVELDVKGLKFGVNKGPFTNKLAYLITDQKGLDAAWPADREAYKAVQEKIKKQADLDKQQLLYFAWSGSSGDELTYKVVDGAKKTIVFTYKPGADNDITAHHRLFAFPKGWLHKVEGGK